MNLLKETIGKLSQHNRTPADVLWVGDETNACTWEQFEKVANFDYDNGYGGNEISIQLKVVGKDWWLERHEYDGSEWWEYKTYPKAKINGIIQILSRGDDEVIAPPTKEEEMIACINTNFLTLKDKKFIPVKDYLKSIDWFYEKYKLLF